MTLNLSGTEWERIKPKDYERRSGMSMNHVAVAQAAREQKYVDDRAEAEAGRTRTRAEWLAIHRARLIKTDQTDDPEPDPV